MGILYVSTFCEPKTALKLKSNLNKTKKQKPVTFLSSDLVFFQTVFHTFPIVFKMQIL